MTKLTLHIQIGRRYVRRDGQIVTARESIKGSKSVCVGESNDRDSMAFMRNGRIWNGCEDPLDLIADAPDEPAEEPIGHPHAELMAQYAEDAKTHAEPWTLWEVRVTKTGDWSPLLAGSPSWFVENDYRRRPRTIIINGHEVSEPLREAPNVGAKVYLVSLSEKAVSNWLVWEGDDFDLRCLRSGLLHLTRDAAEQHARALLSFTMEGEA